MPILNYSNNASTTLASSLLAGATSIVLSTGEGSLFPSTAVQTFPTGETTNFLLSVQGNADPSLREIMLCTARVGDTLTVVRAQEGTTAQDWVAGDHIGVLNTARVESSQMQVAHVQSGQLTYAVGTGTATAITAPLPQSGNLTVMNAGFKMHIRIPATSTGAAMTLKVGTFPTTSVKDLRGRNPTQNSLTANGVYEFVYDGTNWVVVNGDNSAGGGTYFINTAVTNQGNAIIVDPSAEFGTVNGVNTGFMISVKMSAVNTTTMTLKFGNMAAAPVLAQDGANVQSGMTANGGIYTFVWTGTQWASNIINRAVEPIGTVKMFRGNLADIPTLFGPGWVVMNGGSGSLDMRDRVPVGAGGLYGVGAAGGANERNIALNQMPSHSHVLTDPGHVHTATSPAHSHPNSTLPSHSHTLTIDPHSHTVNDPGHQHIQGGVSGESTRYGSGTDVYPYGRTASAIYAGSNGGLDYDNFRPYTSVSSTGITINAQNIDFNLQAAPALNLSISTAPIANVTVNSNPTGITMQPAGGNTPLDIRQPYMPLYFIERVA